MSINFFDNAAKKLSLVKPSYLIRAAITGAESQVLDLVRKEQLFNKGVDGDGHVIGTYSLSTEQTNPQKKAGTPYTLFDTGFFTRSFELRITDEDISILADGKTGKDDDIIQKYGKQIIGFTEDSTDKYKLIVQDILSEVVRDIIADTFKS